MTLLGGCVGMGKMTSFASSCYDLLCSDVRWSNFIGFFYYRWPAMGIHGDKSQQERDWVLNGTCLP